MKLGTALQLGRVSNLPTVWTNTLAGAVLAGAAGFEARWLVALLAFSLFYVGGMFLNDAFDAEFDATVRSERPIPTGRASRGEVFAWGFGMMAAGDVLLATIGLAPALAGVALAGTITLYNWHHKGNPLGPLVMGLCRMLVYLGAALCQTTDLPAAVWLGAGAALCYLIGLTYVAKQENLTEFTNLWPLLFLAVPAAYGAWLATRMPAAALPWLLLCGWVLWALSLLRRRGKGDIPRAVVSLIAGIALLDATLVAATGAWLAAIGAVLAFLLTLRLQRLVAGT